MWTLDRQLLAALHDRLAEANWQRGGGKGQRPKPIPRPGVEGSRSSRFGGAKGRPPAEVRAELARLAGRPIPPA